PARRPAVVLGLASAATRPSDRQQVAQRGLGRPSTSTGDMNIEIGIDGHRHKIRIGTDVARPEPMSRFVAGIWVTYAVGTSHPIREVDPNVWDSRQKEKRSEIISPLFCTLDEQNPGPFLPYFAP